MLVLARKYVDTPFPPLLADMRQAHEYLCAHPELYQQALERAKRMTAEGVFSKRAGPNQSLRLCRCQVRNDDDWIRKSIDRWSDTRCPTSAVRCLLRSRAGPRLTVNNLQRLSLLTAGDTLVVCKLDRLARSTRDLLNTLAAVGEAGASFKSLGDGWADTTTPHGRLMLTVLGGLAEFERHLILARTSEGRQRAQQRGVRFGRKPKLTLHQQQEALARRARGEALVDIARSYAMSHSTISRLA